MIISAALLVLVMPQSAASFAASAQTPSTPSWTQQSSAASPPGRYAAGVAYDASDGSVLFFGGGSSLHQALTLDDTWKWDGASWTEQHPDAHPPARLYPSMAQYIGGNGVVLFGGLGGGQGSAEPDDETWTWDEGNWTQQQPNVSPPARGAAGLASDGHGGMLLFGGTTYTEGAVFYDTWTWDGTTWTQQHPATNPPARAGASMAPDGHGGVLLFGGTSAPYLGQGSPATYGDMWKWDGANWIQLHPSTTPPGRWDAGMVYNTASNTVVLFGGDNGPTAPAPPGQFASPPIGLNDMWSWDGTNWTKQLSTTGPSGRAGAAMAYDAANASVVIFGGRAAGLGAIGGVLDDTWTWGGSASADGTTARR